MSKRSKEIKKTKNETTFFKFLLDKKQKKRLLIITLFYLVVYFVLIYLYPFPNAISDSAGYLMSATQNKYLGYRPFGYSKFMIDIHDISTSISFLVFVQYWLNAISTIFFIFTVKYFFRPKNKILETLFEIFSICSITTIYLTNSILSDTLFASLTILWIVFGAWSIFTPKTPHKIIFILIHLILLGLLFSVRYTGLFYILITLVIALITFYRQNKYLAIVFSSIPIIVITTIYFNQIKISKELTGIKTFSGFSGWQMANNALHVLPHIKLDTTKISNKEVKEFVHFATTYDTLPVFPKYNTTAEFLWTKNLSLKQYTFYQINQKQWAYLKVYTYLGENVFSEFNSIVLKQHPLAYLRYFIFPNMLGVLYPTNDDIYQTFYENAIPQDLLLNWFEINNDTKFYSRSSIIEKSSKLISIYMLILWIIMFLAILLNLIKIKSLKWTTAQNKIYWIMVFFVLSYFAFHTYAAPFFLRHIAPIHLIQIAIIYFALNYFDKKPKELNS